MVIFNKSKKFEWSADSSEPGDFENGLKKAIEDCTEGQTQCTQLDNTRYPGN